MSLNSRTFTTALAVSAASLLMGCGSDGNLAQLAGNVTFDGRRIIYGQIEFVPDRAQNHQGPGGSAEIVDGHYDTRQGGHGVLPGPHLVRITAYEKRPLPASDDENAPSNSEPPLFTGFTLHADLLASDQLDFDVPKSAKGFNLFRQ